MDTTVIFRVEDTEGFGPYLEGRAGLAIDRNVHPEPENDGIQVNSDYIFGFANFEQFKKWFTPKLVAKVYSDGHDWMLTQYSVPTDEILFGGNQVMFSPESKVLVSAIPLAEAIMKK